MTLKIGLLMFVCFAVTYGVKAQNGDVSGSTSGETCNNCLDGTMSGNLVCLLRAILGNDLVGTTGYNSSTCSYCGDGTLLGSFVCEVDDILADVAGGDTSSEAEGSGCYYCGDGSLYGQLFCRLESYASSRIGDHGTDTDNCSACGAENFLSELVCIIKELIAEL